MQKIKYIYKSFLEDKNKKPLKEHKLSIAEFTFYDWGLFQLSFFKKDTNSKLIYPCVKDKIFIYEKNTDTNDWILCDIYGITEVLNKFNKKDLFSIKGSRIFLNHQNAIKNLFNSRKSMFEKNGIFKNL